MGAFNPEVKMPPLLAMVLIAAALVLGVWVAQDLLFKFAPETPHVSPVRSDLRSLATALESYRIDWSVYPPDPHRLTTPVPYVTAIFRDPFSLNESEPFLFELEPERWRIHSIGPDQIDQHALIVYDPTNGTVSAGDVIRVGPEDDSWETK